ncbi:uncharacterized protein B0J16DRAFT_335592 [Fusarium flagelliforme]|uniref:uncharacterized protein n=1 Tax=Fusarium flagelliforme TaxID=2675880 RepID=UPI001E8CD139|nr:uncharacterized protein B0J16DRAFT_335592 [Fusarium flagelliforme]KAH7193601.1 hypothetical protein B0J16DRAFT_335592 [Fusarium flagelliforme]
MPYVYFFSASFLLLVNTQTKPLTLTKSILIPTLSSTHPIQLNKRESLSSHDRAFPSSLHRYQVKVDPTDCVMLGR